MCTCQNSPSQMYQKLKDQTSKYELILRQYDELNKDHVEIKKDMQTKINKLWNINNGLIKENAKLNTIIDKNKEET